MTTEPTAPRRLLSIVTPCFNEEANVRRHYAEVRAAIEPFMDRYDFEHVYTDNDSTDGTFALLRSIAAENPRVKLLKFSRNIGANRAAYQGLIHATGDAAVLIQADLQDPPGLLPDFIRGWEDGFDVVYGKIQKRDEALPMRTVRRLYYAIIARLADVATPENAGEFRILSRRVLEAVKLYREDDIYLRGIIAHIGFRQKPLLYERAARRAGRTSFNLPSLLAYALNGLVSTSVVPLRMVILVGLVTSLAGFGLGAYTAAYKLLYPNSIPHGVTALVTLVTFFAGMQTLSLGIIGEYIRKIYVQSLGRPQAFVAERVNFD